MSNNKNNLQIGVGKRVTLEDVVLVAQAINGIVIVDDVLINKLNDTVATTIAEEPETSLSSLSLEETNPLPEDVIRAGIISRVVAFSNGVTTIRKSTFLILIELINQRMTPKITSIDQAGEQLVEFLQGKRSLLNSNETIDSVVSKLLPNTTEYTLSSEERQAFLQHPFMSTGLTSVVVQGASSIIKSFEALVCLSVECASAKLDLFDSALYEAYHAHRGQMQSATTLKLLLEGSKRVVASAPANANTNNKNNKNTAATTDNSSPLLTTFHNIPQVVGPCQELLTVTSKSLDIELNSAELLPLNTTRGIALNNSFQSITINSVKNALAELVQSTEQRIENLLTVYHTSSSLTDISTKYPISRVKNNNNTTTASQIGVITAYYTLQRLSEALAEEISIALTIFHNMETFAQESSPATNEDTTADSNTNTAAAAHGKKPTNDDSNLTPEQLAKAEAKRKAKAEKAALKASKKQSNASTATNINGLLGHGSSLVRQYFVTYLTEKGVSFTTNHDVYTTLMNAISTTNNTTSVFFALQEIITQLASATSNRRKPKIAKGARDFTPEQMRIREEVFTAIKRVFKRHGGVEIDTPVFELKEVLTGKYGEDSKLIYDLADQGGELLSLRYDLTVPFARFLAMNSVGNIKRYHIAKVYRRDNPQLSRGRYREFYQCDFDIAGTYPVMMPDAEVITVATEILSYLPVGNFAVKLNHRRILDAVFEIAGVPAEKFRPVCSAVDKLDKNSWEEVKSEMVLEKGLSEAVADRIGEFVLHSGKPWELLKQLHELQLFTGHDGAQAALTELHTLFTYLEAMGSLKYISFDLSLARGLDYYTGVIYEVVLTDGTSQIGSIAAGGRYDNLVGMFSVAGVQTPCVGVSIGIERVFTIMERKAEKLQLLTNAANIQVYIASIGAGLVAERMRVAQLLWEMNISAEYSHHDNPKFKRQLDEALERGIPYMIVFGDDEINRGILKVKDMRAHTEVEVPREKLLETLFSMGCSALDSSNSLSLLDVMKRAEQQPQVPQTDSEQK